MCPMLNIWHTSHETEPWTPEMTKPAVLFTGPMMDILTEQVAKVYTIHKYWEAADKAALLAKVGPTVEAIATGGHTGVKTDAAMIAVCPNLRVISNFGVGYDSIDAVAAAKKGIIVTNTPDVLTEEVADTALGLLLMTVKELSKAEAYLRAGKWATDGDFRLSPASLRDRKLGMVGMGRIGQSIATRCAAFGMPISYFARSKRAEVPYPYYSNLVEMAKAVDTLMVITPGGPETKDMINADVLAALGPRGILINVARGTVVDETALIAALRKKTILAAGLDVFWNEPKINPELMTLENATLLPHVGSSTIHTRNGMAQMVVDNLLAYAARTTPVSAVAETPFKAW
jgi:lactate dehydrogenase-like 2-hydroxyacid dehydrogenase